MVNHVKKYDWSAIQRSYDSGLSWRLLSDEFGVSFGALQKAKDRGDLISRSKSEAMVNGYRQGRVKKYYLTETQRLELSELQSLKNRGGRCKWYEVSGQMVQGTWERDAAIRFEELGVRWEKVSRRREEIWRYEMDGKSRSYTPDFYLPDFDLFVEIKGYWWGNDEQKMKCVREQHAEKRLIILQKDGFSELKSTEPEWLRKTNDVEFRG